MAFVLLLIAANSFGQKTATEWLNKGVQQYNAKQLKEAIKSFDESIRLNSKIMEAHYNKGLALMLLHREKEALQCFNNAVEVNPNSKELLYNRGLIKVPMKDYEGAISDFTQAIELDSMYAEAYSNRATVYKNQGKTEEALRDAGKAIRIQRDLAMPYGIRAEIYSSKKQWKEALADLEMVTDIKPSLEAYYLRGDVLVELKRYKEAVGSYSTALAINRTHKEVLIARGKAYLLLEDSESACDDFVGAAELNSVEAEALLKEHCGD